MTRSTLRGRRACAEHAVAAESAHLAALVPAWARPTPGEARWPVVTAVVAVISLQMLLPPALYPDVQTRANFVERALDRVAAVPGVLAAGTTQSTFLPGAGMRTYMVIEGMAARIVMRADADHDGLLSADEAAAAAREFVEKVDTEGGGILDFRALAGALKRRIKPPGIHRGLPAGTPGAAGPGG